MNELQPWAPRWIFMNHELHIVSYMKKIRNLKIQFDWLKNYFSEHYVDSSTELCAGTFLNIFKFSKIQFKFLSTNSKI